MWKFFYWNIFYDYIEKIFLIEDKFKYVYKKLLVKNYLKRYHCGLFTTLVPRSDLILVQDQH
jgi:hypothetical protein